MKRIGQDFTGSVTLLQINRGRNEAGQSQPPGRGWALANFLPEKLATCGLDTLLVLTA